ncbi:DUF3618 domain-containing protein [soil metagenome]
MTAGDPTGEAQAAERKQPDEREQLREEIEKVREDLGETVEALANKADVKGQARDKVQETKAELHEKVEDIKTQVHDKVEQVKAQLGGGGGEAGAQSKLRETLAKPAVPGAIAALCAVLLVRSILRRR